MINCALYYLSTAIFRSEVAIIFSMSTLSFQYDVKRLVLIGTCMVYFIHLHHVTSRYLERVTHYVNVSVLVKFSLKTSVFFYFYYHKICIKSYVVKLYSQQILWINIDFSLFIILIPTPDFPHFYYMLGHNLGSLLYGDVSVMTTGTTAW